MRQEFFPSKKSGFSTLTMAHSGTICLNGAAARMVQKGDLVIIVSYVSLTPEEAKSWKPTVVKVDSQNRPR